MQVEKNTFPSFDGAHLVYRAWLPDVGVTRSVVLFHRGHEYGARLSELVERLAQTQPAGTAFYAWDARGHGESPGPRGHARHFSDLVRDVDAFFTFLKAEHGLDEESTAVVAHSVGAVVVGRWALDYAPRLRALVLVTPALHVKLFVPFARQGLTVLQRLSERLGRPQPCIDSYVTGRVLTHDAAEARAYDTDPRITKRIAVNVLLGLYESAERLVRLAADIEPPTMVMSARADWVVKNLPMRRLYRKLPHPLRSVRVYREAYHGLLYEQGRATVHDDISHFINTCFAHQVDRRHLLDAHVRGASRERYEWHKAGLPWLSPRRFMYRAMRFAMATVGRLSEGIRLGLESGFSSGRTLAYVYRDEAKGITPLGKVIDRTYLDSPGWAHIRVRRAQLQELVRRAVTLVGPRDAVRVFDLAGGPGHYLIDLAQAAPSLQVRVRDFDVGALAEGRQRAAALGVTRIAFEQGDAFDAESLATLGEGWQVGIISGLLELFPDNDPVRIALGGAARAIEPGGYLVYTNQPWHPQIELIAETLTHGDGRPWIMRCRSQAEMDELVRDAGFDKVAQLADDDAIFTVSLARRR